MNSQGESGAAAERPIRRLLVRYGRSGNVAWFGTIHDVQVARGDAVVVLTALGEWPGVVLRESPSAHPTRSGELSGELLRRLGEADQAPSSEANRRSQELAERARQEVRSLASHSSASTPRREAGSPLPAPSLTVIDAEVSLCGRFAVVWYAGRGGPRLGPAAARLADAMGLERVQWMALEAPPRAGDEPSPAETVAAAELDPQHQPVQAVQLAFEALRARDPAELGRVARRAREPLGMLGAYVQKIRGPIRGPAGAEPNRTAASSNRRWMIRLRATAGGVTFGQLDQLAGLAQRFGNGSLRLTMRQGLQMHGVVPGSAEALLGAIERLAMTTRGSCGNVFRNVTCCPHSPRSAAAVAARQLAATITQQWLPRAEWLSWTLDADERQRSEFDAAYPEGYLPHKWKLGVATVEDNCIDVLTNDVALVVGPSDGSAELAVDCYVGGSLAYRPGEAGSFAMLAEPLGRFALADVGEVLRGLTQVHRQISATGPRHWRRLKYLVRRLGAGELAERVEHAVGRPGLLSLLPEQRVAEQRVAERRVAEQRADLPGWRAHPPWTLELDGRWTRTVGVVGGRMWFTAGDSGDAWLQLCRFGRGLRIGPRHTLVIEGIAERDRAAVDALIAGPLAEQADEDGGEDGGELARGPRMLACVALPTCPLAVAEAERTAGEWRRALEPVAGEAALLAPREDRRQPTAAISGCSNGCSHPLTSTVGIVAEGPRRFRVFAGGDGRVLGVSLGTVSGPAELAERVRSSAERFRRERRDGEEFIDWWNRCRNRPS